MKKNNSFFKTGIFGSIIGLVNGFFGAGGGLICVPLLMKLGLERKQAHMNAVAVILPITIISAASYLCQGHLNFNDCLVYLPGGLIGSILGTVIMKKISPDLIKRIFGVFMVWAGWRLMIR